MNIEMLLQDALHGASDTFKDKVRAINSDMKNKTIEFIKFVNNQSVEFHDNLKIHAQEEHTKVLAMFQLDENLLDQDMEEEQRTLYEILLDIEELNPMLERFREFMEAEIGKKETIINKSILGEQEQTERRLADHQHSRNRGIVKEIVDTCESFKKDIKEEFTLLRGEDDDV
mmetsp:Transcript_17135/g.26493  ORF Transcript_17135/g.26493 Transcript_17135/m.26493 type:complete len:172 (+) Transcript_17135:1124-1639(+)